jgi:hypothetical protein
MAFLELGKREDVDAGLRKLCVIPLTLICPLVFVGFAKDAGQPPLLMAVLGGAAGGAVGFLLGELLVRMFALVWPPRLKRAGEKSGQ